MADSEVQILITVSIPESLIERLRAVSSRLNIHVHPSREADELPEDLLPDVEILYTSTALPDPEAVPKLRWIQLHYAGLDHLIDHTLLDAETIVTTLSGAAAPQMAEFALMAMLALGHHLPAILHVSAEELWAEGRFKRYRPDELRGSTVGIVGYGSIGREIARLCKVFGASVLAIKRDLKHLEDEEYSLDGLGDPSSDIPHRLYPPQAIKSMLELCDYVVIALPLTPETRGMVGEDVFMAMKPSAYLVDISRGGVVDHGALVEGLNEKQLAGAALDVYPVEPLPGSSPLWDMPNVILSPHVAGSSVYYAERAMELFAQNLERYLGGQDLLNLFDPERGY